MHLNPLMKIENIEKEKLIVKLLVDKKSYQINRNIFLLLLDIFKKDISYNEIKGNLSIRLKIDESAVSIFLNNLMQKKILLDSLEGYPIEQIEYWRDHKWLTALIYHLESQNIECVDDDTKKGKDKKTYNFNNGDLNKIWKKYEHLETVNLPKANLDTFNKISFEDVLLNRNSFSPFRKKPIDLNDFSNILTASNKTLVRNRVNLEGSEKKLYNSSFAALETYIFVFSVVGIKPGIYHYNPKEHFLSLLQNGDYKKEVTELCIGQKRASSGGCLFLFMADTLRYMDRYKHERGYRNLLINVAEFAQHYIFYSTALGYSTFITPAIKDEYAALLLGLNSATELPLYTVAIG